MTAALLGIGLSSAFVAGLLVLRAAHPHARTVPVLTLACFVVVGAVSLTQLAAFPRLLGLLMRDSYGGVVREPWRLVTSLLVQDGAAVHSAGEGFTYGQVAVRSARTAVGQTADGQTLLVVTEGPREGRRGQTVNQQADQLAALGARVATSPADAATGADVAPVAVLSP